MRQGLNLNDIQNQKKLASFDVVHEQVENDANLNNEDVVVSMEDVRVTPELSLEIPKVGTYSLTQWSRRQIAALVGVTWDRWFDPLVVTPSEIQEELLRRFKRTHKEQKIRTRRFPKGSPLSASCMGTVRAVLSPTYHAIDNTRLFRRMKEVATYQSGKYMFMSNHLNKSSAFDNDRCSHYTIVNMDPVDMGPFDRQSSSMALREVYDMAERAGSLPGTDYVYNGYHLRNSEVGYSAITLDEFSFRLVCLNGAMVCAGKSRLMYRTHRPTADKLLDSQIRTAFLEGPSRWNRVNGKLSNMKGMTLADPIEVLIASLEKREAPRHFIDASVAAHALEPIPSAYGVVQAVTRAAQSYDDMDQRYQFESIAGNMITSV